MKATSTQFFARTFLILAIFLERSANAQTFSVMHTFTKATGDLFTPSNIDGSLPDGPMIFINNKLYGTTYQGGTGGTGTIFAIKPDGSGFTNLHNFGPRTSPGFTNIDGISPSGKLALLGNKLFGVTSQGGSNQLGVLYALNADGSGFTNLYHFPGGTNGSTPAELVGSNDVLYGVAYYGGVSDQGTVFRINTDGSGFTNLHLFNGSDGANPYCGLLLSENILYGSTSIGGSNGNGTLFSINTDGTGFSNFHHFSGTNDGSNPCFKLVQSGGFLYGTAEAGGSQNYGTIFAVQPNGTNFHVLHNFSGSDGINPYGGLSMNGNLLYGSTDGGGQSGNGVLFIVNTNGNAFTLLYNFSASPSSPHTNTDGAIPRGGLVISNQILYGVAYIGGYFASGTIFSLTLPTAPQLAIKRISSNVVLSWPTNIYTYTLQATTNLVLTNWVTVTPSPVVVNGFNTVTNLIGGTQMFYRLTQ